MPRLVLLGFVRHLLRHPWQLGLTVLGIALGVAVVVAVDLANSSARESFSSAVAALQGDATHSITGPNGVPESVYVRLRRTLGERRSLPVVTAELTATAPAGQRITLVGTDALADADRSRAQIALTGTEDLAALLTDPSAGAWSASLGETLTLAGVAGEHTLRRHGEPLGETGAGLVLVDIATAQAILGRQGRLDRIDLVLPAAGDAALEHLRRDLPPGITLDEVAPRTQATAELSRAFQVNLLAMSLLALLVGMFLIYNTMTFAVVQRRALIGRLRALGVSRREVFATVLVEALMLGAVGTVLGLVLGVTLGGGLVTLVERTIDELYHPLTIGDMLIAPLTLIKGIGLGLAATVIAALGPAREAASSPVTAVLSRAELESAWRARVPRVVGLAIVLAAAGALVLMASDGLVGGFVGLFCIVIAVAVLVPLWVMLLVRLPRRRRLPWWLALAVGGVDRHLSRTAVAVAALTVAVATTVGVGVMVGSFRSGVDQWLAQLLNADLYVSPMGDERTLAEPTVRAVTNAEGLTGVSTYRHRRLLVGGRFAYLVALDLADQALDGYQLLAGDENLARDALRNGQGMWVSEPFARRHGVALDDPLTLDTPAGPLTLPVRAVFRDYGSEHGRILLALATYRQMWADPAISSFGLYGPPTVIADVRDRLARQSGVAVSSDAEVHTESLAVFDRTFTVTQVLRVLAVVVAVIGVISALLALQLERSREYAMLRALGVDPTVQGRLIALESVALGLAAGLAAIPLGLVMAWLLLEEINLRAFAWSLPFVVQPRILIEAVLLAAIAALIAAIYPAVRLARRSPAQDLRALS